MLQREALAVHGEFGMDMARQEEEYCHRRQVLTAKMKLYRFGPGFPYERVNVFQLSMSRTHGKIVG